MWRVLTLQLLAIPLCSLWTNEGNVTLVKKMMKGELVQYSEKMMPFHVHIIVVPHIVELDWSKKGEKRWVSPTQVSSSGNFCNTIMATIYCNFSQQTIAVFDTSNEHSALSKEKPVHVGYFRFHIDRYTFYDLWWNCLCDVHSTWNGVPGLKCVHKLGESLILCDGERLSIDNNHFFN